MLINLKKRPTQFVFHGLGLAARIIKVLTRKKETKSVPIGRQQIPHTTLRGDTLPKKSTKS
jgi:hypothetical protein